MAESNAGHFCSWFNDQRSWPYEECWRCNPAVLPIDIGPNDEGCSVVPCFCHRLRYLDNREIGP